MAPSSHIIKRLHGQHGSASIWFALCMPVLLGFAALAIDLARINLTRVELQNAADAAALAGARSLSDTGGNPYNWTEATATALDVARRNSANSARIQDALIEMGYWNLQDPSLGLRDPGTPGVPVTGDVPAIRTTVTISATQNNGPLKLFFAPILGIAESDVRASAIAVLPAAGGGTGMFPFAIGFGIFDHFWDTTTRKPRLDPNTAQPYSLIINLDSVYPKGGAGTWSSLTTQSNADSYMRNLIDGGINVDVSIGMDIYIASGVMANLYGDNNLPIGKDVAVPVVQNVSAGSWQPVVAIAGFHIESSTKQGNKSYITGHFIDNATFGTTNPGIGNGQPLGAYSPPILVE
ncbi:MAG: hypothetical protein HGB02_07290 [Chlorobiaceae bacterium]|nr:hypothetical protein [Chlorobiaceae bacterium]